MNLFVFSCSLTLMKQRNMKQRIDIGITTSSASESFRILKVLLVTEKTAYEVPQVTEAKETVSEIQQEQVTEVIQEDKEQVTEVLTQEDKEQVTEVLTQDKEQVTEVKKTPENSSKYLIVISKRSDPPGWVGVATTGKFDVSVEVDVDETLPVHYYVIGLDMLTSDPAISDLHEASRNYFDYKPNVPHRKLRSSKDLVVPHNVEVLYENPETEEIEEENFKKFWEAENKYFAAEKEKMDTSTFSSNATSSDSSNATSNTSTSTNTIYKVVNPIIRPSSPGVADSSACVGSRTEYDYDYELPLSVKIMAFTTVGILGILFIRSFRG